MTYFVLGRGTRCAEVLSSGSEGGMQGEAREGRNCYYILW
jgi:hypothetical protein